MQIIIPTSASPGDLSGISLGPSYVILNKVPAEEKQQVKPQPQGSRIPEPPKDPEDPNHDEEDAE